MTDNFANEDFDLPLSLFLNVFASGQNRSFCFADEVKPPANALVVTREDIGSDFPDNAGFLFNGVTTWRVWAAMLAESAGKTYAKKTDAFLFSPTRFDTKLWLKSPDQPQRGFRCVENATTSALAVIDADANLQYDDALARLRAEGVEAIIHTSASNRHGDRFRVIVPLASPVDVESHKAVVRAICQCLKPGWDADTGKLNCYSLFYMPGQYRDAVNQFDHLRGAVRSAEEWCARYPVTVKREEPVTEVTHNLHPDAKWSPEQCDALEKYRSLSSNRHTGLYSLMLSIAMSAVNWGYDLSGGELTDIADREQIANPPSSRYTRAQLHVAAQKALDTAYRRITDPVYRKRDAYYQAEYERFRADMQEEEEEQNNEPPSDEGEDPMSSDDSDVEELFKKLHKLTDDLARQKRNEDKAEKLAARAAEKAAADAKKAAAKAAAAANRKLHIGSDLEVADHVHADMMRAGQFVHAEGSFWQYNGSVWVALKDADVVMRYLKPYDGEPYADRAVIRIDQARAKSILKFLATLFSAEDFFGDAKLGINVTNGFIELGPNGTFRLVPHGAEQKTRVILPGAYEQTFEDLPPLSLLSKFFATTFHDDPERVEKVALLQEIAGSALVGNHRQWLPQPKAVILHGRKANNGKSELLEMLEGLVGSAAHVAPQYFTNPNMAINLRGQHLNTARELTSAETIASNTFKETITGEPLPGKILYRDICMFRPVAQHVFSTQRLPPFGGGMDQGCRRRLIVLEFNRVVPQAEMIPNISAKILKTEFQLLLSWAIEGASRLIQRQGFTIPASSREALEGWVQDADPVTNWMRECVRPIEKGEPDYLPGVLPKNALGIFYEWAAENHYSQRSLPRLVEFRERLAEVYPGCKRSAKSSRFFGIKILTPAEVQAEDQAQSLMDDLTNPSDRDMDMGDLMRDVSQSLDEHLDGVMQ